MGPLCLRCAIYRMRDQTESGFEHKKQGVKAELADRSTCSQAPSNLKSWHSVFAPNCWYINMQVCVIIRFVSCRLELIRPIYIHYSGRKSSQTENRVRLHPLPPSSRLVQSYIETQRRLLPLILTTYHLRLVGSLMVLCYRTIVKPPYREETLFLARRWALSWSSFFCYLMINATIAAVHCGIVLVYYWVHAGDGGGLDRDESSVHQGFRELAKSFVNKHFDWLRDIHPTSHILALPGYVLLIQAFFWRCISIAFYGSLLLDACRELRELFGFSRPGAILAVLREVSRSAGPDLTFLEMLSFFGSPSVQVHISLLWLVGLQVVIIEYARHLSNKSLRDGLAESV
jgi:hypothetical protein